ncbi:MAG TPA: tetratricopeptide repeat protein [Candidatus Eisenbacteria bacterium]|nr:tetratricopeptide repeat protein [Candidatus Eisenbacteria bacterium]
MAGRPLLFLVLFVTSAAAQFDTGTPANNPVRIHVAYSSGLCDSSTRVELMQGSNSIARGAADKNCMVEMSGVPMGRYRMIVSGRGFAGIESNEIEITSFDSQPIEINIPQAKAKSESVVQSSATSLSDLRVPKRAAKEFDKASHEMDAQQWGAAAASLERAIAIYPQYAAAYNNLGVVYARGGDRGREAEALQHAIAADSHYVPAYVNLGRMEIAERNFGTAESELKAASALDPENGIVLVLLIYAEYMNQNFDDVISDCSRVHALNNVPHAFAHWSAAFAREQKHQIAEAGAEFSTFVQEQSTGQRADDARKELANIANYLSGRK